MWCIIRLLLLRCVGGWSGGCPCSTKSSSWVVRFSGIESQFTTSGEEGRTMLNSRCRPQPPPPETKKVSNKSFPLLSLPLSFAGIGGGGGGVRPGWLRIPMHRHQSPVRPSFFFLSFRLLLGSSAAEWRPPSLPPSPVTNWCKGNDVAW